MKTKLDKILRINLTEGSVNFEPIEKEAQKFIGGKGLATYYLMKELKAKTDPLSTENKLIIAWGPLTALAPTTSRFGVFTKSPLTGGYLDAYSGGHFPAKLRFGLPECVGIIFEGQAEKWTYLEVDNGKVELKNAENLREKSVLDLYEIFGKSYEVACIGVGGEKMVRYATISSDRGVHHAGRGGAGAVMGSKRLKCIVARGDLPELPKEIKDLRMKYTKKLSESGGTQWAIATGTAGTLDSAHGAGLLPTRGFSMSRYDKYKNVSTEEVKKATKGRKACYLCPLHCGYALELNGKYSVKTIWGPEYESIGMLGPNCDVDDLSSITVLADLCDKFGIDSIEVGSILGWMMRCGEEGVKDFGIKFGDVEKSKEIIKNIAYRDTEMGNKLAEGIKRAAAFYGGREFTAECKGMSYPAYDPRGSVGMALAFATSDRGACHKRAWPVGSTTFWGKSPFDYDIMPKLVKEEQDKNSLLWSLMICDFGNAVYLEDLGNEWLKALGYEYTSEELMALGERIWNMVRMFNIREGFSRKDDYMPELLTKPLAGEGPTTGKNIPKENFEKMLDAYYALRGWTKEGVPSKSE